MCIKIIFGKADFFAPLLSNIEAIILCSVDFDLGEKKSGCPHQLQKSYGQPDKYFFRPHGLFL